MAGEVVGEEAMQGGGQGGSFCVVIYNAFFERD
jgi:hypothetical protein